jgi:hypothetical protein
LPKQWKEAKDFIKLLCDDEEAMSPAQLHQLGETWLLANTGG